LREACGDDSELRGRIEARLKVEAIPLPLKPGPFVAGPGGTMVIGDASDGSPGSSLGATTSAREAAQSCASRFLPGTRWFCLTSPVLPSRTEHRAASNSPCVCMTRHDSA
jgi:hypothetical protein